MIENENGLLIVDNSSLDVFGNCPRQYYWRSVRHLTTPTESPALTFGHAFHLALYHYWNGNSEDECLKAFVERATAEHATIELFAEDGPKYSVEFGVELLMRYFEKRPFDKEDFEVVRSDDGTPYLEMGFALDIQPGPDDPPDASGIFIGKIDAVVRNKYNGEIIVVDHKTTSHALDARWVNNFNPNNQVTSYLWAVKELFGFPATHMLINGIGVMDWKTLTFEEKDRRRYNRVPTTRTTGQINDRLQQIRWEFHLINQMRSREGIGAFRQNAPNGCTQFFRRCDYVPLCMSLDVKTAESLAQTAYKVEKWTPYELPNGEELASGKFVEKSVKEDYKR